MQLLERESAIACLTGYVAEARGGLGRVVFVGGEAGVGKSALIEHLRRAEPTARWVWGACDGLFTPPPLAPLFDVADQLGGALQELCRAGADRDLLFRTLLAQLSDPHTLDVLVVEDVHWADGATLDLLRFLARRVADTSVLLIVVYRDDGLAPDDPLRVMLGDLASLRSTRRIGLAPLSAEAVRRLADGSGLDASALHELTGGNPFYVTEVLRAGLAAVPATARDAVLARAARLSGRAREVLDAAALIGTRIELPLLQAVTASPADAVDELLACGLLDGDGRWLRFRHEIARLAVAQAVAPHRAADVHRRVLHALRSSDGDDDARFAFHAEAAGDGPAVLRYAPAAARRAARLGAHREAAVQFERALRFAAAAAGPAEVATLHDGLADALLLLDRSQDASDACERAIALWREVGDPLHEGDSLGRLSRILSDLNRGADAVAAISAAVSIVEPLGPTIELARAYAALARLHMLHAEHDAAIDLARRARTIAESLAAFDVVSDALNTGAASARIKGADWTADMGQALEIALTRHLSAQVARAYANFCGGFVSQRRFTEFNRYYLEGTAYCDEHDLTTYSTFLRGERSTMLCSTGQWDESRDISTELLSKAGPSPANRLCALLRLGTVRARRGEPGVWDYLDEAAGAADGTGEPSQITVARVIRAEAYWLEDDLPAAKIEAELADDACRTCDEWDRGAVATWLRRTGSDRSPGEHLAEPHRLLSGGQPRAAAQSWTALGCRYDAALALAEAPDEESLREALTILDELGASPAARIVRRSLRRLGVRSIPTGPRADTRAHRLGLTNREREVLALLRANHTNAEIAAKLLISAKTVDHHVSAILTKLGAPNRRAAADHATRLGL